MQNTNISAPLGDTIDLDGQVTNTDENGVVTGRDISDPAVELRFTAKTELDLDDTETPFQYGTANTGLDGVTITDGANGYYTVRIPAADQLVFDGSDIVFLHYDVELTEPGPVVTTVVRGRLALEPDVTKL